MRFLYLIFGSLFIANAQAMHRAFPHKMHSPIAKQTPRRRDLHIDAVKNLYNGLPKEIRHLSPVHGAALYESGWIRNLYKFGNKNLATTSLINHPNIGLFNLNGTDLRPSLLRSSPAFSLNAQLTAKIVSAIEQHQLSTKGVKEDIAQLWRTEHKKQTGDKVSHSKTTQLLDLIHLSSQECNQKNAARLFLPFTTQSILTGFLYRKSTDKSPMTQFLHILEKELGYHPFIHTQDSTCYERTAIQDYEQHQFSIEPHAQLNQMADETYEKSVWYLTKNQNYENKIPPMVKQNAHGFAGQEPKPDCMEASLRSIINQILSNGNDTSFDLSMLAATIKPRAEFIEYYQDATFSHINELDSGKKWMHLVSGIPNAQYANNNYELEPTIHNIITVFNSLLNLGAKNLEQLGSLLSTDKRTITFKHVPANDKDIICISFSDLPNDIELHLEPTHASIHNPNINNSMGIHSSLAGAFINSNRLKNKNQEVSNILALVKNPLNSESALASCDEILHSCFSTNLDNPHALLAAIGRLLPYLNRFAAVEPVAQALIEALPDDPYFRNRLAHYIIHMSNFEKKPFLKKHIENADSITTIISDLLIRLQLVQNEEQYEDIINFLRQIMTNDRIKNVDPENVALAMVGHGAFGIASFIDEFIIRHPASAIELALAYRALGAHEARLFIVQNAHKMNIAEETLNNIKRLILLDDGH